MEANVKHLQHQLLCLFANEVLLQADNFTAAPVSRPSPRMTSLKVPFASDPDALWGLITHWATPRPL